MERIDRGHVRLTVLPYPGNCVSCELLAGAYHRRMTKVLQLVCLVIIPSGSWVKIFRAISTHLSQCSLARLTTPPPEAKGRAASNRLPAPPQLARFSQWPFSRGKPKPASPVPAQQPPKKIPSQKPPLAAPRRQPVNATENNQGAIQFLPAKPRLLPCSVSPVPTADLEPDAPLFAFARLGRY